MSEAPEGPRIWLVMTGHHSSRLVVGAYSTEERAMAALDEYLCIAVDRNGKLKYEAHYADIEDYPIDAPPQEP